MAVLTATQRNALPKSAFALPGRRYPIHDEEHARDALARAAANGTSQEKLAVRRAVKKRYPNMKVGDGK
jgi:hypothetical protein